MTTQDERLGEVAEVPAGVQVRFRRSWPDPIADVWAALTESDRTARWIGTYEGERRGGGSGTLTMTEGGGGAAGQPMRIREGGPPPPPGRPGEAEGGGEPAGQPMRIVECDPPHRLVVQWETEEAWRIALDLTEEQGRTVLVFTQVFAPGTDAGDYVLGWHWYLDKLDAELGGGSGPGDWDTFLAATGPAYGRSS